MQNDAKGSGTNAIIRLGRVGRLSWGVALGVSLAVALSAFVLVGWLTSYAGHAASSAYLLSLVIFMPVVLTFAERAAAARGRSSSDILTMLQADGSDLRTFAGGWLLLVGYLSLAALLGRGLGQYSSVLVHSWFGVALDARWFALLALLLVALNSLMGAPSIGLVRTRLVYVGLLLVLIVAGWAWLKPADVAPRSAEPAQFWTLVAFLATGLWSMGLLLSYRKQTRQPRRAWLPALLGLVILGGILGAITAAIEGYPHVWAENLASSPQLAARVEPAFLEAVFLSAGLFITYVALGGVLTRCLHLIEAVAEQGFLPRRLAKDGPVSRSPLILVAVVVIIGLIVVLVPTPAVVGLASLGFLWVTALLNGPEAVRIQGQSDRRQPFRLPFHPLFPGLAAAVGIFLPFALPPAVLLTGLVWVLLGGGGYFVYARRQSSALREERLAFHEAEAALPATDYGVVAAITDPYTAVPLIQAGARLAKARQGRLIVLQTLALSEQLPQKFKQFEAQQQLQTVEEYVARTGVGDQVPVTPFVRVSKGIAAGIVDTVREESADLLLLAWEQPRRREVLERVWDRVAGESDKPAEEADADGQGAVELTPLLDTVVRTVACDVAILRGRLPERVEQVLVPTRGSPYALTVLKLGQALVQQDEGQVAALRVLTDEPGPEAAPGPSLPAGVDDLGRIEPHQVRAASVQAGILQEAHLYDVLLMSASKPSLLTESFFGGLPVEVARARRRPTLLVRPAQKSYQLWLRRGWDSLTAIFAALTPEERAEVSAQMRAAARPSINFFVLITLAATIATLGLLQNSPAVIIGAMLVAPLMSPIASMSMSIVEGDVHLMRVAAEAILKGVALAITVSVAITLIAPEPQGLNEISARTHPVLLDLVVALASGAAAGYALSRKEVGAALPGVAIAVALVPPLCVVGYGIATAQSQVAIGAFLLFGTNVIAIILAAASVFLLLGFRPLPAQEEQFRRGLAVSIILLVLIAIPLAFLLNVSLGQRQQMDLRRKARSLLDEALSSGTARLVDVALEPGKEGYIVQATIYNFGDFDSDEVARLERLLNKELEPPITLHAVVLDARLTGSEGDLPVLPPSSP